MPHRLRRQRPPVLTHARALLTSSPEGATSYIDADLRDPENILARAREILDFTEPVAIMLLGIVHFILDQEEAHSIIRRLLDAVPSGSHLAITHACDFVQAEELHANVKMWNEHGTPKMTVRSYDQIRRLLGDVELLEPGLVSLPRWRPEADLWGDPPRPPRSLRPRTKTLTARPAPERTVFAGPRPVTRRGAKTST
ncbi:MAG TPA: SAM-dependent methyltransferase [Spirillospora sp.]